MASSFSLAGAASQLATEARAWLGQQTSLDAAPASYQLETAAVSSDGLHVVVAAVYTIGPRIIDDAADELDKNPGEEPLLLRAKLVAPPDHIIPGSSCPSGVKKLVEHHVRALVAGMTAEQTTVKETISFVANEVSGPVNKDLGMSGDGFLVHRTAVYRISVLSAADRITADVVTEEGAAPTPGFAVQIGAKNVQLVTSTFVHGSEASVAVAVVDPATKKVDWNKQIKVVGVEAELRMEFQGKTTFRVKGESSPSPS